MQEFIERQARRISHLVDDMLDLTPVSGGGSQLHRLGLDWVEAVRRTTENHLRLMEALGKGSIFSVWFPLAAEGEPSDAGAPASNVAVSKSCRILLIDDLRDTIVPLREMLTVLGQEVATARNGKTGIEKAREFCPEIILCDIGLPDMDGYAVARSLRREPQFRSTYLVAVTGYGRGEDRRRAIQAGFDYHLSKPVGKDQLELLLAEQPRLREPGISTKGRSR